MQRENQKLCLQKGEVVRREGTPASIACGRGKLWITQTGSERDVILAAGESFQPSQQGTLVIEALERSCVRFELVTETNGSDRSQIWNIFL